MGMTDIGNLENAFAGAMLISGIMGILGLVLGIILLISNMKIFKKSGKNMWYALIPIYNIIVMMDIIKMKYIELLFILIPIVGPLIFMYKYSSKLSQAFGKSSGFTLGLFFLSFIFIPLLAFSDDKYVFGENAVNTNVTNKGEIFNPVGTPLNTNDALLNDNSRELVTAEPTEVIVSSPDATTPQPVEIASPIVEQAPIMESTPVEGVQPIEVAAPIVEQAPVMESAPVEGMQPIEVAAPIVEQAPIMESAPVEGVQPIEVASPIVESSQNDAMIIETPSEELVIEPLIQEQDNSEQQEVKNSLDNKNLCKNCGAEMPNIVTICPNCGTDNE